MGRMDFLQLPRELRSLATFLEHDERPTAIFLGAESRTDDKPLYRNPAFGRYTFKHSRLPDLRKEFSCEHGREHSKTIRFDSQEWRWSRLSSDWSTLVCNGPVEDSGDVPTSAKKRRLEDAFGPDALERDRSVDALLSSRKVLDEHDTGVQARSDSRLDFADAHTAVEPLTDAGQLDWTRYPVTGLSPWIEYVRSYDWASSRVGPMRSWPFLLRQLVVMIMSDPNPRILFWGDHKTFFYNETCIPIFAARHPDCLGKDAHVAWADLWQPFGHLFDTAAEGKVISMDDLSVQLERGGMLEHINFEFTLLPIMGPDGRTIGVIDELREITDAVRAARRRDVAIKLGEELATASNLDEVWTGVTSGLEWATDDVAFSLCYAVIDGLPESNPDNTDSAEYRAPRKRCVIRGTVGLTPDHVSRIDSFDLPKHLEASGLAKPGISTWDSRTPILLHTDDGSLPECLRIAIKDRACGGQVRGVLIAPINPGHGLLGFLVIGISPLCPWNAEYILSMDMLADLVVRAASFITVPEEQRRVRKIQDAVNSALSRQLRTSTMQAERSEAKFTQMAQHAPIGIYVFDIEGYPHFVNDTYLRMINETRESFQARSTSISDRNAMIHPDDLAQFVAAWHHVVDRKESVTVEYRLARQWSSVDELGGQAITGDTWLLATAFPELDASDNVVSVQGWLTDISHRKATEKLLSQRLEDALENKRQSETFIDMTSHEMRNPLSAILQSADSIISMLNAAGMSASSKNFKMSQREAEDLVEAAQVIILCAQHQKRIVDDILTLSKLDASLLVLSPDSVQPPLLVQRAVKMYEAELSRADIRAIVCMEPSYQELAIDWVILDSSRVLQVIINLLTNAIKFTQYSQTREITICLGASLERPTGKHHKVDFIPIKQGRSQHGMHADLGDGEELFLQIAVTDTGRGLNEEEMKVLFQRFSQASPKTYKQYGGSGLGLFISRELTELQGGQIGVRCSGGKTTFSFFVKTRRLVSKKVPYFVAEPASSAFSSTSATSAVSTRRGSRVLGLPGVGASTSASETSPLQQSSEIEQPMLEDSKLQEVINKLDKAVEKVLHVLIVEDNLINQRVMAQQLRRAGCTVHVANHGLECLEFLERSAFCSAQTPLSIILLDLEMPTMDGLTCIRHIRQRQTSGGVNAHVPVIAITANARSEQISSAIDAGMDQVITKPFRIPELIPQMHSLIAQVAQLQAG